MDECENLPAALERYQQRFARVLAYIEAHPEQTPSIDDLSGVAAFSGHHFHRQFSGYLGMSAYRDGLRRARGSRASAPSPT